MSGLNQRRNGAIIREVCSADIRSVEPTKMKPSQIKTGSQYLRKDFIQKSKVRSQKQTPNIQHRQLIFGDVPDSPRFPLLIKLLDAQDKLSLQVHPPENVADKLGGEPKTEFWYVAAADPGAELFLGLQQSITQEQFKRALDK